MKGERLGSAKVAMVANIEIIYEEYCRRGWTDGLPIIPPTARRVERMVAASGRRPDEEVAEIPPRQARATVEKLAANAVMAGCKPAYFPVLLAMVEAIAEPVFALHLVQASSGPVAVLTVVNGPIRQTLGINAGYGCLGPGWRANATIGRALRLVQLNIGGAIPGEVSKSTQGQPGRYTMCLAEYEEKSPWQPLHVERGFDPEESTVTVFAVTQVANFLDQTSGSAHDLAATIAYSIEGAGSNRMSIQAQGGESVLILCPEHAAVIAHDGWSKEDLKQFLYAQTSAVPLSRWPGERQALMLVNPGRVRDGTVSLHQRASDFVVIVAGGVGGSHSSWCPSYGHTYSVTKSIR